MWMGNYTLLNLLGLLVQTVFIQNILLAYFLGMCSYSNHPVREVLFPDFLSGDAFEVFIDTRDVKTTGWTTRFCHHFFFLPEPVEVNEDLVQAGEITRFRTEDVHELAPASSLQVVCEKGKKSYALHVFIPAESLHGYEPLQFERLGFSYRVSRARGDPAFFTTSAQDFPIEQQPSLWASLKLNRQYS